MNQNKMNECPIYHRFHHINNAKSFESVLRVSVMERTTKIPTVRAFCSSCCRLAGWSLSILWTSTVFMMKMPPGALCLVLFFMHLTLGTSFVIWHRPWGGAFVRCGSKAAGEQKPLEKLSVATLKDMCRDHGLKVETPNPTPTE